MNRKRSQKFEAVKVGNVVVKIYTQERATADGARKVFLVSDYSNGKRRLLGFSDHAKARGKAESIARLISTGESTAAQMRNTDAASYGRAIELLRPTGATLEMAASIFAKAFEILGGDSIIDAVQFYARHRADKIEKRTVAQVVAELIAAKDGKKSTRYVADLRARLNRFANDFQVDISSVTVPDVQRWLEGLKLAARTARNFRQCLCTLFSFAESHGYILKGSNPAAETEEIASDDEGAVEIFTPEQIGKLLAASSPEFLPLVALGAFAGLRTAEIERLDWREIELKRGHIEIKAKKAKTRSRRLVPILPNLAQWLSGIAKDAGPVWTGTPASLIDARANTCKAAGVEWKNNALRHSFISYRLAEIQNAAQVALEAGNSPDKVFRHYRELVLPDAAKAWFAITPERPPNVVVMKAVAK